MTKLRAYLNSLRLLVVFKLNVVNIFKKSLYVNKKSLFSCLYHGTISATTEPNSYSWMDLIKKIFIYLLSSAGYESSPFLFESLKSGKWLKLMPVKIFPSITFNSNLNWVKL